MKQDEEAPAGFDECHGHTQLEEQRHRPEAVLRQMLIERAPAGLGGASPAPDGDTALAGGEGAGSVASWWLPHFSRSALRFPHSKAGLQNEAPAVLAPVGEAPQEAS